MPVGGSPAAAANSFIWSQRGAGLEFVTLGFYRFWLATDIRRHLWSNTHDRRRCARNIPAAARELLIGFLVRWRSWCRSIWPTFSSASRPSAVKAFASIPLVAFFYLFGQFAIYRARRYRLTRTVWRGVRFWMSGSGWIYALRASLWGLLMIVTLGLALPWRAAALERYKMRHSYYGDLQGSFEGAAGNSSSAAGGCGCSRRSPSTCRRSRPSSMARSRRWNGAGGCPASGSAACGWNRNCRAARLIGLLLEGDRLDRRACGWCSRPIWRYRRRWSPA